jgi:hypothetical protein
MTLRPAFTLILYLVIFQIASSRFANFSFYTRTMDTHYAQRGPMRNTAHPSIIKSKVIV